MPEQLALIQERAKIIEQKIAIEYEKCGFTIQVERDNQIWYQTLTTPTDDELELNRRGILRRIFMLLRVGGLMFRSDRNDRNGWKWWHNSGLPISSALSHGSRILIQLPKAVDGKRSRSFLESLGFSSQSQIGFTDERNHDHGLWRWLIAGNTNGDISKFVSVSTNGDAAELEKKIIFRRLGATHGIDYHTTEVGASLKNDRQRLIVLPPDFLLKKDIIETKDLLGISMRNTKIFGNVDRLLTKHRHWGMNIAVGGIGNPSFGAMSGTITANGSNGHLYLYYMSPGENRFGGIMIGVEGSEYGKIDQSGAVHSLTGSSSLLGITLGYKWNKLNKDGCKGLGDGIPDKYDSLFIDLSSGWRQFIFSDWKDDYVRQSAMIPACEPDELIL